MSKVKGVWKINKWNPEKGANVIVGAINLPADCVGDELYSVMQKRGLLKDLDLYEVEGDSSSIAIMAKNEGDGDFMLEFVLS